MYLLLAPHHLLFEFFLKVSVLSFGFCPFVHQIRDLCFPDASAGLIALLTHGFVRTVEKPTRKLITVAPGM
jgi:predicted PurR-regulated permease PerM